ncbi:cation:proton antiporter [Spirochaeta lutea]|uniref:Sodium:proton exchanger n=1 Tax=Spirochaeta lutea TaxID=1480694 RepID=A0A098QVR9_9SPIO|nr:cation:proton antiporter [Spirochaeta lutea]KGE71671.1 sodium:proton exchanger [Spirochaeta lutea]
MELHLFLYLAALFASAYAVKVLTSAIKVPEVTGYVLLGVILGISVIRLLNEEILTALSPLSTVALGIIAFLIGSELRFDVIRRLGMSILSIVVLECLAAFGVVFAGVYLIIGADLNTSLLLAAVASATAPAATVAVIRQYKAKGTLTSTILAVVGIDDAVALIIYVFVEGFVAANLTGATLSGGHMLGKAVLSLLMAGGIGLVAGFLYVAVLRRVKNNDWITLLLAAAIFGLLGISEILHVSELLSIMVFGMIVANASPVLSKKSEGILGSLTPIFLAAFFILGGAHLNLGLISRIGLLGLVYFAARALGKIGGATLGAIIGRAPKKIRGLIGLSLLPQVGVALALALAISKQFTNPRFGPAGHDLATVIINVLLFTTIITEIIGPLLTRFALGKAGEIHSHDQDTK